MENSEYEVTRKLQKQTSGAYVITLPKLWVEKEGLKQSDLLSVRFNGIVKIRPVKETEETARDA